MDGKLVVFLFIVSALALAGAIVLFVNWHLQRPQKASDKLTPMADHTEYNRNSERMRAEYMDMLTRLDLHDAEDKYHKKLDRIEKMHGVSGEWPELRHG